jgi:hypothetical protein
MSKFEIQTYTLCDGWVNTWTIENEEGISIKEYFNTSLEALECLNEFFDDVLQDFNEGNLDSLYDRDDYRIVEVLDPYTCPKFEPALED